MKASKLTKYQSINDDDIAASSSAAPPPSYNDQLVIKHYPEGFLDSNHSICYNSLTTSNLVLPLTKVILKYEWVSVFYKTSERSDVRTVHLNFAMFTTYPLPNLPFII